MLTVNKKHKTSSVTGKKVTSIKRKKSTQKVEICSREQPVYIINTTSMMLSEEEQHSLEEIFNKDGDLDKHEAMGIVLAIGKTKTINMKLCYLLSAKKGYKALGYKDFKECIMKELRGTISYDYAHKLKNAGEVHMVVCPELPMGEVPEGVLRELHGLEEQEMKDVWQKAIDSNDELDKRLPTASELKKEKHILKSDDTPLANPTKLEDTIYKVLFEDKPELAEKFCEVTNELVTDVRQLSPRYSSGQPMTKHQYGKILTGLLKELESNLLRSYEHERATYLKTKHKAGNPKSKKPAKS